MFKRNQNDSVNDYDVVTFGAKKLSINNRLHRWTNWSWRARVTGGRWSLLTVRPNDVVV